MRNDKLTLDIITFGLPLSADMRKALLEEGFERRDSDQLPNHASGTVEWKPEMLELFVTDGQKERGGATGFNVRDDIRESGKAVYGIADLEQLREQGLIPESRRGKAIFAWGDILRRGGGRLCVRHLCWDGGGWVWVCYWLDDGWLSDYPAAVAASS